MRIGNLTLVAIGALLTLGILLPASIYVIESGNVGVLN